MKKAKIFLLLIIFPILLIGCGERQKSEAGGSKWENCKNLYTTVVSATEEDEDGKKYLDIAERSVELFKLLEDNVEAFVMDAYNYQDDDGEGTPLYTLNNLTYPVEIDPYGQCIRVSKNYFKFNPIETTEGGSPSEKLIYDDLTLNILVPEKYKDKEDQIKKAYRENFYFEKVTATNEYNKGAGITESLDISEEELNVNIIYVKDNQKYFTYRIDCAVQTDNYVQDPIVQIYTSNIHCNYAHSFMSQWVYFPCDKSGKEEAFAKIQPYVKQCRAENSFKKVYSVYEENSVVE